MEDAVTPAKLQKIYNFVLKSRRSDFYRNKYAGFSLPQRINTFEDWQKIPFLIRKELFDTLPLERLFIPEEKIVSVEPSSGTTDKPLVMLMTAYPKKQRWVFEKYIRELRVQRILVLASPFQAYHWTRTFQPKGIFLFIGDIYNPFLTAQIASQIKPQGIRATPTILAHFLPYLDKVYNLREIKYVNLGGEFCTKQRVQELQKKLTQAKFYFRYGGSETGNRGYQCNFLTETGNPQHFHPSPGLYFEVIDTETGGRLPKEKAGEIALTTLPPVMHPTPLLRYRTGDSGILRDYSCSCGASLLLELTGRANFDSLKVGGILIQSQKIQDAVSKVSHLVENDFRLHVYEEKRGSGAVILLELELILKGKKRTETISFLEKKISENLYLSLTATLTDLVRRGLCLPLKIKPVKSLEAKSGEKKKYIISHLIS